MPVLQDLLAPQILLTGITDRVRKVGDVLQRFLGIELGTANREEIPGPAGVYDIFDSVRTVAPMRARAAGPSRRQAQGVHQQPVICSRFYHSIPLLYDKIFPLRKMGGPSSEVDAGGQVYIGKQTGVLRTEMANSREWLTGGMFRGGCYVTQSGDDVIASFLPSAGARKVDWQIPATNMGALDLLGTGTPVLSTLWSDQVNAPIFENVLAIDDGFQVQHGYPLRHIWLNSTNWGLVTNNAGLKSRSGTSEMAMTEFRGLGAGGKGEYTEPEKIGSIRCLPGIVWHIYNQGLSLGVPGSEAFQPFFPSTGLASAVFCPEPNDMWVTGVHGSEWLQEREGDMPAERRGPFFFHVYVRDPTQIELRGWDLWFPALRVPKCLAIGSVA